MLKTILVPLDGSALAERGLYLAATLSIPTAARLVLVRVTHNPHSDSYLEDTANELRGRGYEVETVAAVADDTAPTILEAAQRLHTDLIVTTTHGRSGALRWLLGSVAEALITRSEIPVMVQRARDPGRRALLLGDRPRVLVPVDGSKFAETALPTAINLADDLDAEILLVQVIPEPSPSGSDYLDSLVCRLRQEFPDLRLATRLDCGDPVTAVVELTDEAEAGIVVMATHARTGVQRLAFGSVADAVLRHGRAPLVLVHPRLAEPASAFAMEGVTDHSGVGDP